MSLYGGHGKGILQVRLLCTTWLLTFVHHMVTDICASHGHYVCLPRSRGDDGNHSLCQEGVAFVFCVRDELIGHDPLMRQGGGASEDPWRVMEGSTRS